MVIHFRAQCLSFGKLSCIVKIILLLLQNEWTQINNWKFCFALFLSIRLGVTFKLFI